MIKFKDWEMGILRKEKGPVDLFQQIREQSMIATDRRLAMQGGDLEPLGSKGFGLQKQKQVINKYQVNSITNAIKALY